LKKEHATTRTVVTQETTRVERAVNTHTDTQVLELKTMTEAKEQCKTFLLSLKAPRMNQRHNDVMDSKDASFKQVFATYEEMIEMHYKDSEDNSDSEGYQSSGRSSNSPYTSHLDDIYRSWGSFNSWLQSDEMLFYIEGKPGSGKSTLVKFILDQDHTRHLIQQWSPDATIISYFFWKIGSHEQNSIKGLWCSLLYQRLQGHLPLVPDILQHFEHLSLHTGYHDWTIKELQEVWEYAANHDDRHLCIFIDGLDEIRNEDGFSRLNESIQLLSKFPRTKLCVSTRPEAQIMRWLKETSARGFRLEDLTKLDMIVSVRNKLRPLLPNESSVFYRLRQGLVEKAQGVFLWLHLATRSIIEGIDNGDPEDMLLRRLHELPGDLEKLYIDMWQRLNANNSVYRQTAARYFRYVLLSSSKAIESTAYDFWVGTGLPSGLQIACAENPESQETLLTGGNTIETAVVSRMCQETMVSIRTRCAGLLEFQPLDLGLVEETKHEISNAFGRVTFIHRTAHDFLVDTEAGRRILGHESSSDLSLQHELLKGLICMMMISSSQWGMAWRFALVINEIASFAKSRGNSSLQLAIEVLDVIWPLYDKRCIKVAGDEHNYEPSFFSFLTHDEQFDDFVISRLTVANSVRITTDVLREGWMPGSRVTLSKRLFDALLSLGADPHECGECFSHAMPGPFVSKATAFTNLVVSFYVSRENPLMPPHGISHYADITGCQNLCLNDSYKITEMATHMARSCENLNASVPLVGCFSDNRSIGISPLHTLSSNIRNHYYGTHFMIYEVNLQFLLLYLLSRASEDSVESVLGSLGAEDLLVKLNSPWVKMRYFLLPKATQAMPKNAIPVTCHRVAPQASYLAQEFIEGLLHSAAYGSMTEHLFDVTFQHCPNDMYVSYSIRTDVGTIIHGIKGSETEEVSFETMVTDLVTDDLGFFTYEQAGIIPSAAYLRRKRENNARVWCWLPLLMERLEVAAANREERRDREDLP
jgi:hypothetical protein